jgi:hypothetical protein
MTWNYRVVRHVGADSNQSYAFHEVYYRDEVVQTISEESVCPSAETIEELMADFERMKEAFDKPVLDFETLQPI